MRLWKPLLICAAAVAAASNAVAGPISVGYQTTGLAGNWTLDFVVRNNLPGAPDQDLYLFGVLLSAPNVVGSPAGYDPTLIGTWDNSSYGGSSTQYNNVWLDVSVSQLLPGSILSGFEVKVTDATPPLSVQWFAFTVGNTPYLGGGNFGDPSNPGFEGVGSPVPEPGAGVLLAGALGGILLLRGRGQAA
jgi:hypothetical protein